MKLSRGKRAYLLALLAGRVCVACRCAPGWRLTVRGWRCWHCCVATQQPETWF